jgi:guanylate kinase
MRKLTFIGNDSGVGKTTVVKISIDKFKESVLLDRSR